MYITDHSAEYIRKLFSLNTIFVVDRMPIFLFLALLIYISVLTNLFSDQISTTQQLDSLILKVSEYPFFVSLGTGFCTISVNIFSTLLLSEMRLNTPR